jgi:hypothetical protein
MAGEWSTFMGGNFDNFAPVARFEDLVTTESGNELLVYDTRNSELHHLDELSTLVWRHLDGSHTVSDLVVMAKSESANVTDESIRLAIAALGSINLLASDAPASLFGESTSRRRFLKRSAVAGVAIPVIASITAPSSAGAVSGNNCVSPADCAIVGVNVNPCCDCGGGILRLGLDVCTGIAGADELICLTVCA